MIWMFGIRVGSSVVAEVPDKYGHHVSCVLRVLHQMFGIFVRGSVVVEVPTAGVAYCF